MAICATKLTLIFIFVGMKKRISHVSLLPCKTLKVFILIASVTCHQDLKSWDTFYHVASRLIGECTTIVAVEDGKVIGVANYICSSAYGTINYLYVLPKCRHQGIGNALLKGQKSIWQLLRFVLLEHL